MPSINTSRNAQFMDIWRRNKLSDNMKSCASSRLMKNLSPIHLTYWRILLYILLVGGMCLESEAASVSARDESNSGEGEYITLFQGYGWIHIQIPEILVAAY